MMSKTYHCPHCQKEIIWDASFPYRPFCSKRCKMIDFGDWAEEKHKIPADIVENPEDFIDIDSQDRH